VVEEGKTIILSTLYVRYYPVANLTRTRQAVLLEPLRPEKFLIRHLDSTPLYGLSICEVGLPSLFKGALSILCDNILRFSTSGL
jgi:hypothetical protein